MSMPSQSTPRVFLSHSSVDSEFGMRLTRALRHHLGSDDAVWYDELGSTRGGDQFWRKLVAEITARPIFILVTSPDRWTHSG